MPHHSMTDFVGRRLCGGRRGPKPITATCRNGGAVSGPTALLAAGLLFLAACATQPSGNYGGTSAQSAAATNSVPSLRVLSQSNPLLDVELSSDSLNAIDNEAQIDQPDELEQATGAPETMSKDDLSRELTNPNTPLAKLSLKNTTTFFEGDLPDADDQVSNLFLFQPVFPFPLTDDGTRNLFIRPAFAFLTSQPLFDQTDGEFKSVTRLGDMGFDVALGQSFDSGFVVVGGMQGTVPIGHSDVSGQQLRLGPEFLGAYINEVGGVAAFPAHQWNVAGGGPAYSTSTLELFAIKFMGDGWSGGTNPQLAYDWQNDQATIPLNLTLRKIVQFGDIPAQISGSFDYFVEKNDAFGPEYAFTITVTPIVPNFIYDALN